MRATASSTRLEWPCAVSTTTTSTPASISRSVRSKPSSPTVVAAATRRRPCSSLQAFGLATAFSMSFTVIRPTQRYWSSTTRSFSMRCWCRSRFASSCSTPSRTVMSRSLVISSATGWRGRWRSARRDWSGCRPACRPCRCRRPRPPECRRSVRLHQRERVGERRVGLDGDRIDHHAGLRISSPAAPARPARRVRDCGG